MCNDSVLAFREFFEKYYAGTISVSQANETYAEEAGIAVSDMTREQRQLALLEEVLGRCDV